MKRLADLCISGPWRLPRFIRCEHLARALPREGGAWPELDAALRGTAGSNKRGLLIRVPDAERGAALVAGHLRAANARYLAMSGAPPQLGWMVLRAASNELTLDFFATLRYALAGRVDGKALDAIDAARTSNEAAEIVASWFNHAYSHDDPWQAPDVTVLYGVDAIGRHGARNAEFVEDPLDSRRALELLPARLAGCADPRHECAPGFAMGAIRLIVLDDSADGPTVSGDGWTTLDLREIAPPAPVEEVDAPRDEGLRAALSLLASPAPAVVVASALAALGQALDARALEQSRFRLSTVCSPLAPANHALRRTTRPPSSGSRLRTSP